MPRRATYGAIRGAVEASSPVSLESSCRFSRSQVSACPTQEVLACAAEACPRRSRSARPPTVRVGMERRPLDCLQHRDSALVLVRELGTPWTSPEPGKCWWFRYPDCLLRVVRAEADGLIPHSMAAVFSRDVGVGLFVALETSTSCLQE